MTLVHTLSSGSSGNALLLSCGESHLLLDAGISCRRITAALGELGLTPGDLTAILITHTHADHIAGLQTLLKRCGAPVFATGPAARDLAWRLPAAEDRLQTLDTVNGAQTVGENIADLGAVSCITQIAQEKGYDLEKVYEAYAISWATKDREEYLAQIVAIDSHAPAKIRTNAVLSAQQAFRDLYDIQEGDGMYQERMPEIW